MVRAKAGQNPPFHTTHARAFIIFHRVCACFYRSSCARVCIMLGIECLASNLHIIFSHRFSTTTVDCTVLITFLLQMYFFWLFSRVATVASAAGPCEGVSAQLPFCNTSLSFESRVADLIARIPVAEKLALLSTDSGGVKNLGISSFQWWSEGLHGVRCGHGIDCSGGKTTTIFPQPIGAAAAFNRTLWHATGDAISTEFRGFANAGKGFLSIFAPNINIFRDPRWGRGQETPGEDPYLSSEYAVQYVSGMQGSDNRYMKTLTTCKHFAAFNSGFNLHTHQSRFRF